MKKIFLFLIILSFFYINFVSAWEFNGTIHDINGTRLYNATINVSVYDSTLTFIGSNATYSNRTGWFNLSVSNNAGWFYQPGITHFQNNATTGTPIDFVGQSLPSFPYALFQDGLSTNFYLRLAGTINITVVNGTGSSVNFKYIIKDTKLGHPISQDFTSYVSQKTIYVSRDRNYSIMVFPNQSLPVSFDWNNFSSTISYDITSDGASNYNVTSNTLNKRFNDSLNLIWISGYISNSTGSINTLNEFTVIPFILEPGKMLFLSDNAAMPYNMSAWRGDFTDNFTLSTGFYNITLPGSAESVNYVLFATARNGTIYYGGYRNISLDYSSSGRTQFNFTVYPLMSTNWGSANSNITMRHAANGLPINISTARQTFNLVNSTSVLSQLSSHIEVTVNYSKYNATEFTFMLDTPQSGNANFYVPLINDTGTKEMNIYSADFAPKRVGKKTPTQILANNNITLSTFNPESIGSSLAASKIVMELYTSNSTCDVPNVPSACNIGSSTNMDNFNPLATIIGGGKLSFRMGTGNILVHYVDVDMLASGPPDALFDDSTKESTSGDFNSALRFGSLGPTIYSHVLVSIPYTEGSSSTTGLNENAEINMSISLFYDENSSGVIDWNNPIWNVSANGTSGSAFAGNYSHFSNFQSDWATLMQNNTCVTNVNTFNATNPCYLDKTNNRIWTRLPHFSGTKPLSSGGVITATTTTTSASESGGPSSSGAVEQKGHIFAKITPGVAAIKSDFNLDAGVKEIQIEVNSEAQNVKVTVSKYDGKPAAVSVEKTGKIYRYLEIKTENLADKLKKATVKVQVEKSWITDNGLTKEDVAVFKFNENSDEWNELSTIYSSEDDTSYYYEISLDSFSYFAISEKAVVAEETLREVIPEKERERKVPAWMGAVIILVVLAILVGGSVVWMKRKSIKRKK